jgi:hypothetical protein
MEDVVTNGFPKLNNIKKAERNGPILRVLKAVIELEEEFSETRALCV